MSKKATYLGAIIDAGIRALSIGAGGFAGYNLMPGGITSKAIGAGVGGALSGNIAKNVLRRMGRDQYIGVGREGVKPVKVRSVISENQESLINEGIRALREQGLIMTKSAASPRVRGGAAGSGPTGGPVPGGPAGGRPRKDPGRLRMNRSSNISAFNMKPSPRVNQNRGFQPNRRSAMTAARSNNPAFNL